MGGVILVMPITFTMDFRAPRMLPSTSGYSSPRYSYSTTPRCPSSFSSSQACSQSTMPSCMNPSPLVANAGDQAPGRTGPALPMTWTWQKIFSSRVSATQTLINTGPPSMTMPARADRCAAETCCCAACLEAYLHDNCDAGNEISSLLADLGALVVEAPLDGATDLGQVRLRSHFQAVDHCAKAIQHHICIVTDLHSSPSSSAAAMQCHNEGECSTTWLGQSRSFRDQPQK